MTLKYMSIIFHRIFSYEIYERGGLYLLALHHRTLLTQHPNNHCIENQSGVTAFLPLKPLGLKKLLTQGFTNWEKRKNIMRLPSENKKS